MSIRSNCPSSRRASAESSGPGSATRGRSSSRLLRRRPLTRPALTLPQQDDRLTALREAKRVLRPAGFLFAAAISRSRPYEAYRPAFCETLILSRSSRRTSAPKSTTTRPVNGRTSFPPAPAQGSGCKAPGRRRAPAAHIEDVDEWLDDDDRREVLMRAIRRVESEPAMLGCLRPPSCAWAGGAQ